MSVTELKEKLIHQIGLSDDIDLLEDISRIFEAEESSKGLFALNEYQLENIIKARQQIKNGELLSGSQADQEIDEWLKQ